jgi:hypothetical protein
MVLPANGDILLGHFNPRRDPVAGRTLMTLDVRELLRRLRAGETDRAVARALTLARKTVARYRRVAGEEGWLEGPLPEPGVLERRLEERVPPSSLPRQPYKAAPWRGVIEELRRRGVNLRAIEQRLREDHGYEGSYSALWRYAATQEAREPEAFVRIEVPPGEEAQVDFGSGGEIVDPATGEVQRAWVLVVTLPYSERSASASLAPRQWSYAAQGSGPRRPKRDLLRLLDLAKRGHLRSVKCGHNRSALTKLMSALCGQTGNRHPCLLIQLHGRYSFQGPEGV